MYAEPETLRHGGQLYADLLAEITADHDLVAAMWADAESRPAELDIPGTFWSVTLTEDGTPAAWCAARITDGGALRCHSNYERREWRGRGLYEDAYHARHRDVMLSYKLPGVTYLFAQPIALHERHGWYRTGLTGVSADRHRWWELRR